MPANVQFCAEPDTTERNAVLGVFSHEPHVELRRAWRSNVIGNATALRSSGILVRFVLRGINLLNRTLNEHAEHGDMIFMASDAKLPRTAGPLHARLLWYPCALMAFPFARFVGVSDDDMYVHLSSADAFLAALPSDGAQPPTVVGALQCYHWDRSLFTPTNFCFEWVKAPCREERRPRIGPPGVGNASFVRVGPFWFAQGFLVFLSADLVGSLSRNETTNGEAKQRLRPWEDTQLAKAERNMSGCLGQHCIPFEDVWVGYAISQQSQLPSLRLVQLPKSSAFKHMPYCSVQGRCKREFEVAASLAEQRAACDHATINLTTECHNHRHSTCGGVAQTVCGLPRSPPRWCPGDEAVVACHDDKAAEWCAARRKFCETRNETLRAYIRYRCSWTCGACARAGAAPGRVRDS